MLDGGSPDGGSPDGGSPDRGSVGSVFIYFFFHFFSFFLHFFFFFPCSEERRPIAIRAGSVRRAGFERARGWAWWCVCMCVCARACVRVCVRVCFVRLLCVRMERRTRTRAHLRRDIRCLSDGILVVFGVISIELDLGACFVFAVQFLCEVVDLWREAGEAQVSGVCRVEWVDGCNIQERHDEHMDCIAVHILFCGQQAKVRQSNLSVGHACAIGYW